jgi:alginate O-acetyltransferase complex protein AlgI
MPEFILETARHFLASDFYVSLPFWGAFAAVVVCYRLVPRSTILREWLLLLCSVCMLLTLPRLDLRMLAILLGICVITYGCARLLADKERLPNPGARRAVAAFGVVINVLVLAFFKYSFVQQAILRSVSLAATDVIFLIGISYTSFRAIHFILETYKNEIKTFGLLNFLNYMLFFPAFISGPIHRYSHYCANSAATRDAPFRSDLAAGLERIVHGLFKKTVLTVILFPYTLTNVGVPIEKMALWQIIVGLYALALYFYFDFSGYTDLAIGSARIMGFVLPENFDYPVLKRNIQQFWNHWHMSLTSWLTDYIYWPVVRRLRNGGFFRRHPVLLSNVAILVTFLICGIWHGDTLNFAIWGLYHGLGIACVNTYQQWKRKVRNPTARRYFASAWSYGLGVIATFNFFALGQSLFVLNSGDLRALFGWLK